MINKYTLFLGLLCLMPETCLAAASTLDGASLSLWWGIPFAGLLASLALMPVLAGDFWHHSYGKITFGWVLLLVIPMLFVFGLDHTLREMALTLIDHYLPFLAIVIALFVISGGIHIDIASKATPLANTFLLLIGTILAGWIGTTGASMLLIRPLLHMNKGRTSITHIVIFFIFLVSNVGGSATPMGDPPLFLGFLNGVDFSWTLDYLMPETIMMVVPLLAIFYGVDLWTFSKQPHHHMPSGAVRLKIAGLLNVFCLIAVIGLVFMSGVWKPGWGITILGVEMELQNIIRDGGLVGLACLSWFKTSPKIHKDNDFHWEPLFEVGKLFFGIFVTIAPVIAILYAGEHGALSGLLALVTENGQPLNAMYFWMTGILSAFLDNAPTYMIFFYLAGGDAQELMTTLSKTLEAISLGAVFMGAITYIGNAPNFMVKAIAEHNGVRMPSFFGYMKWSVGILVPLFLALTWIEFL